MPVARSMYSFTSPSPTHHARARDRRAQSDSFREVLRKEFDLAMALIAVATVQVLGVKAHGVLGYLKELSTPWPLTPIHLISPTSQRCTNGK